MSASTHDSDLERRLQEMERRFDALVAATGQIYWNATFGRSKPMPSWYAFTGQTADEMDNDGWLAAIHPDDRAQALSAWTAAQASAEPYHNEYRVRRYDGVYRRLLVRGVPVYDDDGALVEWAGFCTDITEIAGLQAEREELLRREAAARAQTDRERQRLYDLFMQAPARIAVARGPDHVFEFANARYVAHLDDPQIVGRPAREVFPGAAEQGIIAVADQVYASGEPSVRLEAPYVVDLDRDGHPEQRYFNVVLEPLRDAQGAVEGVMLFSMDVTETVQARHLVERLAAEQTAILEHMAEGVLLFDIDGTVVYANPAAATLLRADLTGRGRDELIALLDMRPVDDGRNQSDAQPVLRAIEAGRETVESRWSIEVVGGRAIVQGSVIPVTGEDGARLGAVLTFRDVSTQDALDRQKDDFLAAAAHDLRTPLTAIKGITQMLERRQQRGDLEMERLQTDLQRIDRTTDRMARVIAKLLDITRLQMNQPLQLDRQPVDLVALARAAVADHLGPSGDRRMTLEADPPELIATVDGFRLERALDNLLSNAVRYSPLDAEIVLQVMYDGEGPEPMAVLQVCDRGIGIPPADLPHVFERFYRGANVAGMHPGAGLGLAGVRQIVEQHRGTIAVESCEGAGSTFTIRLPLGADVWESESGAS